MKITKLIGCLSLTAMLLTGCNGGDTDSTAGLSVSTNSSETSSTESASTPEEVTYLWDEETDNNLKETLGDAYVNVPVLSCDSFTSINGVNASNDMPYTAIFCESSKPETLLKVYRSVMNMAEYTVTEEEDGFVYVNRRYDFTSIVYGAFGLTASPIDSNKQCLSLLFFLVRDKVIDYPDEDVMNFLGISIPEVKADYYQYYITSSMGMDVMMMYCYGTTNKNLNDFYDQLVSEGYDIQDYGVISAIHDDYGVGIQYEYLSATEAAEMGFEGDMPVLQMILYNY